MEGLFVDSQHCLRIVTQDWVVYTAAKEDGWLGTLRPTTPASARWITMQSPSHTERGVFDGDDVISWESGDKWHRLRMSYAQWELLTRRRYVPATFVLASYLYESVRSMFARE